MHLKEMNLWLWTWEVWARVNYGSMGKASEDTGRLMQTVIAVHAVMLVPSGLRISANLVVTVQLNNGTNCLHYNLIKSIRTSLTNCFNNMGLLSYLSGTMFLGPG